MKKEEAIVIIDSLNPGVIIKTSASDEKIKEAIGMAVKALQEEPVSNDLEEAAQKAYPKDIHKQSIFIHGATYAYTHFKNTQLLDEGLEEAATKYAQDKYLPVQTAQSFKAGAEWQKENLWKPADGDDLPEVDREVIALVEENEHYKVVFAHRPPKYWDGNILTGKVTRYEPKRYDKGGWNMPDVKWWLDCKLPNKENKL